MPYRECGNCHFYVGNKCLVGLPEWAEESIGDSELILRKLTPTHNADNCDCWNYDTEEVKRLAKIAGNAFVEGAKWWEWHKTGFTMWQSDQQLAAEEAINRKMPFRNPIEERLQEALRIIAGLPDKNGKTHLSTLHDVGAIQKYAQEVLNGR